MSTVETILSIGVAIATLMSFSVSVIVAMIGLKLRTALAEFRILIGDVIRAELRLYVPDSSFQQYSKNHSDEHIRMQRSITEDTVRFNDEINKLRNSRHDLANLLTTHTLEIGTSEIRLSDTVKHVAVIETELARHDERICDLETKGQ